MKSPPFKGVFFDGVCITLLNLSGHLLNAKKGIIEMIILNDEQEAAKEKFSYWYKNPASRTRPWFEVSGPAGSGKTTFVLECIRYLDISLDDVLFAAYTGKAALALRISGVPGRTIHSIIYNPIIVNVRDELGQVVYSEGVPKTKIVFEKRKQLEPNIRLIVIDEGGMVETGMAKDLLSYGVPILVLGDLHQLPPVFGSGIFLQKPDAVFTKIMRQVEGSPIIYLSQLAMYHAEIYYGNYGQNGEVRVIHKDEFLNDHHVATQWLSWADMAICATNQMRDMLNKYVRERIQGITSNTATIGDKLICRQNHWDILLGGEFDDIALVNGLVGYCTGVNKNPKSRSSYMEIDFQPEFSHTREFRGLPIDHKYLFSPYNVRKTSGGMKTENILFEFGSVITCHLAQGSQADKVLVFVENWGDSDFFWKWLYTAITRAKKELVLIM